MSGKSEKALCGMSIEEIIAEASSRERDLMEFYRATLCEAGPDACALLD